LLSRWVVGANCKANMAREDEGRAIPFPISINVAAEKPNDGSIVRDITDICEEHGVRPEQIEIELTESIV